MASSLSSNRPSFSTNRLVAEPVVKSHASSMHGVLNDSQIYEFLDESPPDLLDLERRYEFLSGGKSPDGSEHWLTWIVFLKEQQHNPIGYVQATIREPESCYLGYVFASAYWGKGYASECLRGLLDTIAQVYVFSEVKAEMDSKNLRSQRLISSLGFKQVGIINGGSIIRGEINDELIFSLEATKP